MKNSILTPNMKKKLRRTHHNVIHLDECDSDTEISEIS